MTRRHWYWLLVGVASYSLLAAEFARADDPLPLSTIVLYNSGVGFFEHAAQIEGDKQIELKFDVDDVNDLLKSMVLRDQDGGTISRVTYGSRDPITTTLKTFAIDLTGNPTLADLLGQVRGERVSIAAVGGDPISGIILGVEKRKERAGDETIDADYLNLLTDAGLRSFGLASVASVTLLNDALDRELREALAVLALGHSTDKKTVTLNFAGQGKRRVRVGYVQGSPIWKTSYRLVVGPEGKAMLQGWAIVENTTEGDWKNVSLTLVSGRPISFVMNLYQPLYVNRPVVEPELFASLRPQVYGQDFEKQQGTREQLMLPGVRAATAAAPPATPSFRGGGQQRRLDAAEPQFQNMAGVATAASASDLGELFQYVIDKPVVLPRQQSALLSIVQENVKAEKLSIYNPAVQPTHPLNGLRLHNTTALHLMQGPITVFDSGAYAGDAQIEDMSPGSERLLSYAIDLDVEVVQDRKLAPEELVSVRIAKGALTASRKQRQTQRYTVKNSGRDDKRVLIEQPYASGWKLLAPQKPDEKTRDRYRFAVQATPHKPVELVVEEEAVIDQQFAISNFNADSIEFYIRAKSVSDNVKSALSDVAQRKQSLELLTVMQKHVNDRIEAIGQEQGRIRENMQQLDHNSELYGRYVKKFTAQEDEIERLRTQANDVERQIEEARRDLDQFLLNLDVS
ncbi:MAG TPA: hypothetical protein VHZ24_00375 [Pirellulales bacterium]|jgi:hypothetical protein|nr:hypothetical protein [Pirellulales bacterium]